MFMLNWVLIISNILSFFLIILFNTKFLSFSFYLFSTILLILISCYITYKNKKLCKNIFLTNFVIFIFSIFFILSSTIPNDILNKFLFLLISIFCFLIIKNKQVSFKLKFLKKSFFLMILLAIFFSLSFYFIGENSRYFLETHLFEKIILLVLISLAEEILFLGFFYKILLEHNTLLNTKILTSFYFSFFHIFNFFEVLKFYDNYFMFILYILFLFLFMIGSTNLFEKSKINDKNLIIYSVIFHLLVNIKV